MKNRILLILTIIYSFTTNAQEYKESEFKNDNFTLSCKCIKAVDKFNSKKGTYNYAFETKNRQNGYMISVRDVEMSKQDKTAFLKSIKNAGVLDFKNTYFLTNNAIIANFTKDNYYGKQIGFFSKNKSYTITIIGDSEKSRNNLYENLIRTFKTK